MECVYNDDSDRRRRGGLKRDIKELRNYTNSTDELEGLVARIRAAPESELEDIITSLRAKSATMSEAPALSLIGDSDKMSESEDLRAGKLRVDGGGDVRHFGYGSNAELLHLSLVGRRQTAELRQHVWTSVTQDEGFMSEMLVILSIVKLNPC